MGSKVKLPGDRTKKQPATGYCINPECFESSDDMRFEFGIEGDLISCPKCKADESPTVGVLSLIHHLVVDPKGPIRGADRRFRMACDPARAYMATATNKESATGDIAIANCPGCLDANVDSPTETGEE